MADSKMAAVDDGIDLPLIISFLLPILMDEETDHVPQHDSLLTGNLYYEELMQTPSEARFLYCVRSCHRSP